MRLGTFAVFLVVAVLLAGCAGYSGQPQGGLGGAPGGSGGSGAAPQQPGWSRAVFTIADKAADMGSVTAIRVTVDQVQVHSAAEGWVTVSSTPRTYDLLQLKASGAQMLLADANLSSGTYGQARLLISNVVITDASGPHEAKLPSGELKIIQDFELKANSTSAIKFDFAADRSLHLTGRGEYVLAPVVRFEHKEDADVEEKDNDEVEVRSGRVRVDAEFGMDENGRVYAGPGIAADADVAIEGNLVRIVVRGGAGGEGGPERKDASGNASAGVNVGIGAGVNGEIG